MSRVTSSNGIYRLMCALVLTACGGDSSNDSAHPPVPTGGTTVSTTTEPCEDCDGDGLSAPEDCDDQDALVFPGAAERCNYADDDCDGFPDNGFWTPEERDAGLVLRCADMAGEFTVTDQVVSDLSDTLSDPEFDAASLQFTWVESGPGLIWVGAIDPDNGALIPRDGRGQVVASNAAPISLVHNGPEWFVADDGPHVLYTDKQGVRTRPAHAYRDGSGLWVTERLETGTDSAVGTGTATPGDENPRFSWWNRITDQMLWSYVDGSAFGLLGPFELSAAPRFVAGTDLLVWSLETNGVFEAFLFDLADDTSVSALTSNSAGHFEPFMWQAPERPGELWFMVSGAGDDGEARFVEVYGPDGDGYAAKVRVYPPADHPFVVSPEAMITGTESYVSFLASDSAQQFSEGNSTVWMMGAMPDNDVLRRVSEDTTMVRKDPESVVTPDHTWMYYTEVRASDGFRLIHRCDPGIDAP